MADSRSSKEGSAEGGHGTATGSSSPTDDSSHSTPSKVVLIIILTLLNNMSIKKYGLSSLPYLPKCIY